MHIYLCRAIRHSCACAYALRAGDTRYNCANETSFELSCVFSFFFQNLSAGPSSVISADRAGGARPLLGSSSMRPHPFFKGVGLETRARATAKTLHNGAGCACSFAVEAIAHHGTATSVWTSRDGGKIRGAVTVSC